MLLQRLARLDEDITRRRELIMNYRRRLPARRHHAAVPRRATWPPSGYVMPIMLSEPGSRATSVPTCATARRSDQHLLPGHPRFTAYRERFPGVSLPRTELAARTEVTIPLYAHLTEEEQVAS